MSEFKLKSAEGAAHANGDEWDIGVDTSREINARTQVLHVNFDVSPARNPNQARAIFVKRMMRSGGRITRLSDDWMCIVHWK